MAAGRKYGQGRGMPDPGLIEDPGMRACYDAVVENILYLLSNPFATTSPTIEVLDGDNIVVDRLDQNTFRVNCNLDVTTAIEDSKEEEGGILIYNQSTEDMPAGGAGEVVGTMEITDNNSVKRIIPIVDKPSADSLNPALVMFAKETIDTTKLGAGGSAYDDDLPDMVYDPDGADLAAGDAVGTADGEWHLKKANTGFLALGKQITWDDNSDRIKARPNGGNSNYTGPFAVVQKDATTVTVLGYHADDGRNWRNYIDVGLDTPLELTEQDIAVSASGYVYLTLTQTAGAYNTPTVTVGSLPTQDNTHYYHRLAYVTFDTSITSITQFQYGGIALPGRIF